MSIRTINELFYQVVERNLEHALLFRRKGQWISIPGQELYRNVLGVARALRDWGIQRGDRVAILSENRPEWVVADFAAMLLGAVVVPIYPTLTREQMLYLLRDSGARVLFLSTADQLRKLQPLGGECAVEKLVVMDYVVAADVVLIQPLMHNGPIERDQNFDAHALEAQPEDLATIIYTSGTTGTPRGVLLTHRNLTSNLLHSLDHFELKPGQVSISFLPLSHVFARHVDYLMLEQGVTLAYCPFMEELPLTLAEVRPHILVAVPRVFEKMYDQVQSRIGSGLKRRLYNWAIATGRKHRDEVESGLKPSSPTWKLADRLVFSKIKQGIGGRVEILISGSAPLNRDLLAWYAAIGMRIYEGYGLTETSPVVAVNNPTSYRPGSVGQALKNLEVRIAEDGEILVKGPSVFQGYWNRPEETAAAFDGEWLRTGDIGRLDSDEFLYITDRKKDLIKTSGGKFIAPQPIESSLKSHDLVAEAMVIADRRNFPCVLIAPNFPALEDWAKLNGVPMGGREQLVSDPQVCALYQGIVDHVNVQLAKFEKIKKVLLVADEFSVANGALTPTMKLKRRIVEDRYRQQLDALYSSSAEVMVG